MDWGSFILGGLVFGTIFGFLGTLIGGLAQMAARQDRPSDLTSVLREASTGLEKGEVISFTIGHDVCMPSEEGQEEGRFWENN